VTGLTYKDRTSGELRHLDVDGIFVQIGLLPNTEWLKGTVALSPRGEIEVDARGQTSVPGVFAAGDATTVPYKQIVIAMGEGSKAALSAFDYLIRSVPVDAEAAAGRNNRTPSRPSRRESRRSARRPSGRERDNRPASRRRDAGRSYS